MLFAVPDNPAVRLIGPGGPRPGRPAIVVTGADGAQLILTGSLGALAHLGHAVHTAVTIHQAAESDGTTAEPLPLSETTRAGLARLPHTGLLVPDPTVHVTDCHPTPDTDNGAYTATLRRGPTPLATLVADGTGPLTADVVTSHQADVAAFLAACRTGRGRRLTEAQVWETLVAEYEQHTVVDAATRSGQLVARRCSRTVEVTIPSEVFIADPPDDADPDVIAVFAARVATPAPHLWWQWWDGGRWRDITAPPSEQDTSAGW